MVFVPNEYQSPDTVLSPREKAHSDSTDLAGTAKISFATNANLGNWFSWFFHQTNAFVLPAKK